MAGRIHGRFGQVYMDLGGSPGSPIGGSPYAPVLVGDVKSFNISMKTDRADVTAQGDTNKRRVAGLPDYSGSLSCWYNTSGDTLTIAAAILAGTPVFLRLMPDSREPTTYFEGLSNLDGDLKVDVGGGVSFDGTWDAAGDWALVS